MQRFIPSPHYKYDKPSGSSTSSSTTTTEQTKSKKVKKADNRSTLEKLFKKRFKERTSPPTSSAAAGERDGDGARPVPDIVVESPVCFLFQTLFHSFFNLINSNYRFPQSTRSESDVWSEKLDAPPNNLLSPDHANIPLAGMDVPDPIVVMPYNAPTIPPSGMDFSQHQVPYQSYSYQNQNPSQGNSRSQTPGYSNQSKNPIPAGPGMGELPFGFVPTSYGPPVIPSPSLRTGGGGSHTLPPSHISSQHHPPPQLPGTVGSGSGGGSGPSSPYAVAPIPANVVYPNPPARSPIPTSRSPRPVSPQRTSPIPRDVVNLRMSNLSGSTSTSGTGENVGGGRRDKLSPLSLGKPFHGFATSDG